MGSFNTTCFASRQTIAPGDPCIVIPLVQQASFKKVDMTFQDKRLSEHGYANSICHPVRFWTPVAGCLHATYDDCCEFNLLATARNTYNLHQLIRAAIQRIPTIHEGANAYHEAKFDLRTFMSQHAPDLLVHLYSETKELSKPELAEQAQKCWGYIAESVLSQRLFWGTDVFTLRPFSFGVVHQAAYDELIRLTEKNARVQSESHAMYAAFERALAFANESHAKAMNEGNCAHQLVAVSSAGERFKQAFQVGLMPGMGFSESPALLQMGLSKYFRGELTKDRLFEVLRPTFEWLYFCEGLSSLNLHFEPLTYAGQNYDNSIGCMYYKFIREVNKNMKTMHR